MTESYKFHVKQSLVMEAVKHVGTNTDQDAGGAYEGVTIATVSGAVIDRYVGDGRWEKFKDTNAAARAFGSMSNHAFVFDFQDFGGYFVFYSHFGFR